MEFSNADPLDWTVDEVVNILCYNPETPWSKSNSSTPRPNPASFAKAIRDNLITGEVLLQDVDKNILKDDLNLKAVGHRGSIMRAIGFLQQCSPKFQTSKSEQSLVLPSPSPLQLLPHLQHTNVHSSPAQHSNPVPPTAPSTPSLNKPPATAAVSGTLNVGRGPDNLYGATENSPEINVSAGPREVSEAPTSNQSRSHENIVVDEHGKKRRRLNLTTFAESRGGDVVSEISSNEKSKSWYMGPNALTLDQVFYSSDLEGDDQTFTLVPSKLPNAQRTFVNRRLSYFFQQSPIELGSGHGFSQKAVVPYKSSIIKSSNDRFFTLYTAENGAIKVSKERINDWPRLGHQARVNDEAQSPSELPKPSDPFLYLLQKYPAEEGSGDAFPIYGDSGSEGEFDEETWREMEEEQSEPIPHQQRKLGLTEVESIIKDCVSAYEANWRESYMPREHYKARKLWLVARRGNRVNQETKALVRDIGLLAARLQKLQEEIRKNEYTTAAELRIQCQCLELTVFNIQKQKFRVSVLEQEKCPLRVPAPPKPRNPPKLRTGDEESLDSESDFAESDFDDFIVDDVGTPKVLETENSPDTSSSSDGDDDIISVSGIRRKTRGQPPKVFGSSSPSISPSPSPSWPLHEKPEVIDLTMEEPDDLRIETPPLNPVGSAKSNYHGATLPRPSTSMSPPPSIGSLESCGIVKAENDARSPRPKISDIEEILSLDWEFFEARKDRRRLLAKLIGGLANDERTKLAIHIPEYQFSKLKPLVRRALKSLGSGRVDVPGMNSNENRLIMRTASFYVAWLNCIRLDVEGIPKKDIQKALNRLDSDGFDHYYDELIEQLQNCHAWKQRTETTGQDSDQEFHDTPHKKRKREVKESQSAKMTQASAQRRVAQQEKQKEKLEKRLNSMGLGNDNPSRQAVSFKDPVIYLNSHIGQHVKPHQLKGIQFMWRELIEDKDRQGCLLAHTMGLGKTMQVISLLTTIYEASASSDPRVVRQVPEALRPLQTLIICPSSLIENWQDEFNMWSPKIWPMVRRVSTAKEESLNARLQQISAWYDDGGVLLISYNIFRRWIINNNTDKQGKPLSDADHDMVKRWLLQGPNLIIADEAHKMKNASSATYLAAIQFRSTSRIALTGSPLANNLSDYYTMVNWIAEDYLGSAVEFKANYIEPIEQGLYADSTHTERRRCLMRLQVLKQILEPKINRADITVLAGNLPLKVEFVLTVPLTKLQKTAYDYYAAFVLRGRMEDVAQTQLWSWLAILGLCCKHPASFWEKLQSRVQDAAAKMSDGEQQPIPGDESIDKIGIPDFEELVAEQRNLFAQVTDLKAVELSARTEIVNRIIDESIKAGDKVLIFSQSLPALNYLEHVLQASGRRYSRLDGRTIIPTRQAAIKQFNQGQLQVYLISTRAGGLGLNIQAANRVIIFDFSFSPTWEEQAVGRAYRLGQQKPVYVYRFLTGGTFEEIIHHKAIFKTQLSVRVVDKKNPIRFACKKPGDYLFPAKPVPQQDTSEYIGKDKLVLDNILREDQAKNTEDRLIRDITLTETFQREDNDKLTDEEKRSVQEEFDDENLRRRDPVAYNKRFHEKQMKLMQQQNYARSSSSVAHGVYQPSVPQGMTYAGQHAPQQGSVLYPAQRQGLQFQVPNSAHNNGPPALVPDMISYQPPKSTCESGALSPFTNSPPIGDARENTHVHPTGPSTDARAHTSSTPGPQERQKFGCGNQ